MERVFFADLVDLAVFAVAKVDTPREVVFGREIRKPQTLSNLNLLHAGRPQYEARQRSGKQTSILGGENYATQPLFSQVIYLFVTFEDHLLQIVTLLQKLVPVARRGSLFQQILKNQIGVALRFVGS